MPVTDADLQLLEAYLDDELDSSEAETLRQRLQNDVELASALENLKLEHQARASMFKILEPSETQVAEFTGAISQAIRQTPRNRFWLHASSRMRMVAAAAACLIVGFLFGRFGTFNIAPPADIGTASVVGDTKRAPTEVTVTDIQGNVHTLKFESAERAQEFFNDVQRLQKRLREAQAPSEQF